MSNCIPLADCLTDVSLRESSQQAVDLRGAEVKTKIELLKRTLRIGIKCVELTAFAPGKWFADARALTEDASNLVPDGIVLRALYFNPKGLHRSMRHHRVLREGIFHTAVTAGYRKRNFHQGSIDDVKSRMDDMLIAFTEYGLIFDTLVLATAWGTSREKTTPSQVLDYLGVLMQHADSKGFPVNSVSLADTIGRADPTDIGDLIRQVKIEWPKLVIRVHLHSSLSTADERIHSAMEGGTDQWEAAWGGVGGSPFAQRPEANMDIRSLVRVYRQRGLDHGLNIEEIEKTIQSLKQWTTREIADITM